jgi:hypothetical protein
LYHYVDQRVATLPPAEQFLLGAMRRWIAAIHRRMCPPAALHAGFAAKGVAAALPHFHMALLLLARDGLRPISFAPVACGCIREDEAMLLGIFAQIGSQPPAYLPEVAALLVQPEAVTPLSRALAGAAIVLAMGEMLPDARKYSAPTGRGAILPKADDAA